VRSLFFFPATESPVSQWQQSDEILVCSPEGCGLSLQRHAESEKGQSCPVKQLVRTLQDRSPSLG
jgi:hypothetical protein